MDILGSVEHLGFQVIRRQGDRQGLDGIPLQLGSILRLAAQADKLVQRIHFCPHILGAMADRLRGLVLVARLMHFPRLFQGLPQAQVGAGQRGQIAARARQHNRLLVAGSGFPGISGPHF